MAATAPAPNSRGPHLSVLGRRLSPLPATPFFQASLPSLEPKTLRRASFRMPSDETLRFTLVCKLPLLHFTLSRVAVHNARGFSKLIENPVAAIVRYLAISFHPVFTPAPSSSAPAFSPARRRPTEVGAPRCPAWSELPLRTHNFRSFYRGWCDHDSLFGLPVGSGLVCRLLATV